MSTPRHKDRGSLSRQVRLVVNSKSAIGILALLVFGSAAYLGGVGPGAVPLGALTALVALLCTGIELRFVWRDPLARALLIGLSVAVLHAIPVPPFLSNLLDRRTASMSAGALIALREYRDHVWRPMAADPGNNLLGIQLIVGVLAAYLAARRAAVRGYGESLLRVARDVILWVALIALGHRVIGADRLFGLWAPEQARPPILAPILNANHLAAFEGAGLILWIAHAIEAETLPFKMLRATAAGVCGVVWALSLSRGGIAATAAALLLMLVIIAVIRRQRRRVHSDQILTGLLAGAAVLGIGAYVALDAIRAEYATGDTTKLFVIRRLLQVSLRHWAIGLGIGGAHVGAADAGIVQGNYTVEAAENIVVDSVLSFGIPAGLLICALVARFFWQRRPSLRERDISQVGAFAALFSLVVHDLLDFSLWFGPAAYLGALLAGRLTVRRGEVSDRKHVATVRWPIAGFIIAILWLMLVTWRTSLTEERARTAAAMQSGHAVIGTFRAPLLRHPGDPYLNLLLASWAIEHRDPMALRAINRALNLAPAMNVPHGMLARYFASTGRRAQAIIEFRLTADLTPGALDPMASEFLALHPTPDEIERATASGSGGLRFLGALGRSASGRAEGPQVDAIILARSPTDAEALTRSSDRALEAGDVVTAARLADAIVRTQPRSVRGFILGIRTAIAANDEALAARLVSRGLTATGGAPEILELQARLFARRRSVVEMRSTIERLLEAVGGDIDRRIQVYALSGDLEESLGNHTAALGAFERADSMTQPQHPYLDRIIALANRIPDVARLRAACATMRDFSEGAAQAQRDICSRVERTRPAPNMLDPLSPSVGAN